MWKEEMRKKDDMEPAAPTLEGAPRPEARPQAPRSSGATIGPSITIRGEVSGDEDLLIQGRVDGSVTLDLHSVTVGSQGRVKANITGRVITVEGEVEGDLTAQEQVILRGSSRVQGDLKAPRVVLEDGANFRGLVDMGAPKETANAAPTRTAAKDTHGRPPTKEEAASSPSPTAGSPSPAATPPSSTEKGTPGVAGRRST